MNLQTFESGFDVTTYVNNLRNYRSFVRNLMAEAKADPEHVEALRSSSGRFAQPVRMTVMTEDWCGDAACNIPIIAGLCAGADVPLRVFRGSETPQLEKRYHDDGVDHIPVASIWNADGEEIGRWIECPKAVDEKKASWKAERPEFMELYRRRETDKDAAKQFAKMYRDLLDAMAEWYRGGMWKETTREIVETLAK